VLPGDGWLSPYTGWTRAHWEATADRLLAAARSHLEPAAFARDVERGRSFLLSELVDYAQGVGGRAP